MTDGRVSRGRQTQVLLAQWLAGNLFPRAVSRAASLPGSDVLNTPGLAIECKATEVAKLPEAVRQAGKNAKPGELPLVVYRPRGFGPERMRDWLCIMSLRDMTDLLDAAGYGEDA